MIHGLCFFWLYFIFTWKNFQKKFFELRKTLIYSHGSSSEETNYNAVVRNSIIPNNNFFWIWMMWLKNYKSYHWQELSKFLQVINFKSNLEILFSLLIIWFSELIVKCKWLCFSQNYTDFQFYYNKYQYTVIYSSFKIKCPQL